MTLTGPMKCILALVTVAVIAVGFWMLDWQPRLRQCDDLRVEAVQKQQDYRAICEQLRGLTALIHENETLKARLDGLVRGHLAGRETVDRALATMPVRLEMIIVSLSGSLGGLGDGGAYAEQGGESIRPRRHADGGQQAMQQGGVSRDQRDNRRIALDGHARPYVERNDAA